MSEVTTADEAQAALPDLSVQSFAACEVGKDVRLIGAPVDADTIYLVLAGKLHLTLPTGSLVASAGSLVLVPAGMQPSIASSPKPMSEYVATRERLMQRGGLLVFDAAQGGRGALRVLVGRVRGELVAALTASGAAAGAIVVDLRLSPLARSAFGALREELNRPSAGLPVMAATLMKACLLLFIRTVRRHRTAAPTSAASHRIAAVAATIRARPSDFYSVATLATLAGMSRATFGRQFQRHLATTPMEFVLLVRLRDAASLLRTTSLPIKQVASETGFLSRSHFSRTFQLHFGTDPSSFRATAGDRDRSPASSMAPMLAEPRASDPQCGR